MKIERYEGSQERSVLIALITSREVLEKIAPVWQPDILSSRYANLIARWCIDYWEEYREPIGKDIENKFSAWLEKNPEKETSQLIETLLESLSGEYERYKEEIKPGPAVDMVREYLEKQQVKKLSENLQNALEHGDFQKGKEYVVSFSPLPTSEKKIIDPFQDMEAVRSAMEYTHSEPLFTYGGGLGDFFGNYLKRARFLALTGVEKSGKSFFLLDMMYRAMLGRCKVLYFEAGDLTQDQLMERLIVRSAGRPMREGTYKYPTEIIPKGENTKAIFIDKECESPLDFKSGWAAFQKTMEKRVKSKESYFKLHCSSSSMLKVKDMHSVIKNLNKEGFAPDVIGIDYADIMSAPSSIKESRDQSDYIWKGLRGISQEYNCLVVTVTQPKATAYKVDRITKEHFGNDKRKNAHVDGFIAINSTVRDKQAGVYRLNWTLRRDAPFSDNRYCYCAGCLSIANPAVISIY